MENSIDSSEQWDLSKERLLMVSLGCAKNLVDSENMCHAVKEAASCLFHPLRKRISS